MPSFNQYKDGYLALWKGMRVTKTTEARQQVAAILRGRDRLMAVQKITNVPWYVIGILMVREAGLVSGNLDWRAVLHNGERIVGTGRKTRLVPAGRGPFKTWEEAAVDAIRVEGYGGLDWHDPSVLPAVVAWVLEKFNGFGYRNKGIPSPYLWGGTSVQKRGKYVRDGVFSYAVMDPQIGGMALLWILLNEGHATEADHPAETVQHAPAHEPTGGKAQEPQEQPKLAQVPQVSPAPKNAPVAVPESPRRGLLAAIWSLVRRVFK